VVKRPLVLMWTLLALLGAGSASAEMVVDLHTSTVPVADQGSKALAGASRQALAEVLVKVSGSRQLLRNPEIVAALGKSRSHVQQYAYARDESTEAGLSVRIEFDGAFVTDLVRKAGAPLWTAKRPVVLAWVVVDGEQGKHFVNWDSTPQQAQLLVEEFSRRGVPVQIPVFDLVDTAAVSTEDAWHLNANVLLAASARYNVQDVVAGRLASLSGGKSLGDWSYFYQGHRVNRSVTGPDLQPSCVAAWVLLRGNWPLVTPCYPRREVTVKCTCWSPVSPAMQITLPLSGGWKIWNWSTMRTSRRYGAN
jgi:hypothetical protein